MNVIQGTIGAWLQISTLSILLIGGGIGALWCISLANELHSKQLKIKQIKQRRKRMIKILKEVS